jgi:hypothetical protein
MLPETTFCVLQTVADGMNRLSRDTRDFVRAQPSEKAQFDKPDEIFIAPA